MVEQLSVEHVRDLAAYQAKELIDMFGTATGNRWHATVCLVQLGPLVIFSVDVKIRSVTSSIVIVHPSAQAKILAINHPLCLCNKTTCVMLLYQASSGSSRCPVPTYNPMNACMMFGAGNSIAGVAVGILSCWSFPFSWSGQFPQKTTWETIGLYIPSSDLTTTSKHGK